MPIVRRFTATCDICGVPFEGDGSGYDKVVGGAAEWSGELKNTLRAHGWQVGNKLVCPDCRAEMAAEGLPMAHVGCVIP